LLTHTPSSRAPILYFDKHGFARLAAYVPGDRAWKNTKRQFRVTRDQAEAAIRLGQLYVAVVFPGSRARSLVQCGNLSLV
jgi:hypothetical protein